MKSYKNRIVKAFGFILAIQFCLWSIIFSFHNAFGHETHSGNGISVSHCCHEHSFHCPNQDFQRKIQSIEHIGSEECNICAFASQLNSCSFSSVENGLSIFGSVRAINFYLFAKVDSDYLQTNSRSPPQMIVS